MDTWKRPITETECKLIISTIQDGFLSREANPQVAFVLKTEANLGIRISDILKLKLRDFVRVNSEKEIITEDGTKQKVTTSEIYIRIIEKKTKKERNLPINQNFYDDLVSFVTGRKPRKGEEILPAKEQHIFTVGERWVEKVLRDACKYLGLPEDDISTHSFRKLYAMNMYDASGHNIFLVSKLLQHSSVACTQRYLGLVEQEMKDYSKSIYI